VKNILVDLRSGIPIYIQIMDQIRHQVASGDLKPDDQLPTVRQLAAELRVNFNTIARAYRLLDEAGLISTQQGRGTYIVEPRGEDRSEMLQKEAMLELTRQYIKEAAQLGYGYQEMISIIKSFQADHSTNNDLPEKGS
jgi:GntR family transcriptional regulator